MKRVIRILRHPKQIYKNEGLKEVQVWGILILLALIWGSSFILMDKGLDSFSPLNIAALRMVIAGLCLFPFCISSVKKIPKEEWKIFPILGMVGNGIPAFLFPLAEQGINSATAGILNSLTPVFTLIFGILFGITISRRKVLGIALGLAGAVVVTLGGSKGLEGNIGHALIVVFATMLYGMNVNIMKRYLNFTPPVAIAGFSMLSAALPYGIYLLFSDIPQILFSNPEALHSLGFIAILAVLGTAVSTLIFYHLVQITDAIRSSSVTYLMPIVACMWGLLRPEREDITLLQIGGMLVILTGVYIVNHKKK